MCLRRKQRVSATRENLHVVQKYFVREFPGDHAHRTAAAYAIRAQHLSNKQLTCSFTVDLVGLATGGHGERDSYAANAFFYVTSRVRQLIATCSEMAMRTRCHWIMMPSHKPRRASQVPRGRV